MDIKVEIHTLGLTLQEVLELYFRGELLKVKSIVLEYYDFLDFENDVCPVTVVALEDVPGGTRAIRFFYGLTPEETMEKITVNPAD